MSDSGRLKLTRQERAAVVQTQHLQVPHRLKGANVHSATGVHTQGKRGCFNLEDRHLRTGAKVYTMCVLSFPHTEVSCILCMLLSTSSSRALTTDDEIT
jgi:hypothetical protein